MQTNIQWKEQALAECPEGKYCAFCGSENDFYDDLGWFYISPYTNKIAPDGYPEEGVCCKACWYGPHGQAHVARYGLGDR